MIRQPRDFPSIEELLQHDELMPLIDALPRPIAAEVIKSVVASRKQGLKESAEPITVQSLITSITDALSLAKRREIRRVINATGVIIHTNLGRAPLSDSLFESVRNAVTGYGNIEFDLTTGQRGSRGTACEHYLSTLAEAESATVVNNCAAALFLIVNSLANRKKVIISRGELVQIGGGFRIPDILRRAGARLCEVGTTNITTLADYEQNLEPSVGLILKVHKSNFVQAGFTDEVPLKELVALGHSHKIPIVNDLGSGLFSQTAKLLTDQEPTVQQSVRAGTDLTCFSGDKMLGGLQSGLIVGKKDLIVQLKKNPLFRTVRVDKIVLAMLERLLVSYLNDSATVDIRLWSLLAVPVSDLYRRGKQILSELGSPHGLSVEATSAYVGGGALPESEIPSVGIVFSSVYRASELLTRFRACETPIIGRIDNDRLILDLKAVDEADFPALISSIRACIVKA